MRKEIKLEDGLVDKLVKEYNNGKTIMALAKENNLSYKLVYNRLHKYGATIRTVRRNLTDEEKQDIISSYGLVFGASDLARKYDTTITTITSLLKISGVKISNKAGDAKLRTGSFIDRGCFTDFNREADAYFYGLLLSDGCLVSGTNSVQLTLKHTDSNIVIKYREWLKAERDVTYLDHGPGKKYRRCSFIFSDYVIANNLVEQGFESNKSMKEKVPKFYYELGIDSKRHFWRGMVDGDGTLGSTPRKLGLVGSKEIITEFHSFVQEYCNSEPKPLIADKRYPDFYYAVYNGERASKIAKVLYENSNYSLDRKRLIAESIIPFADSYRMYKQT